jgi:hypothetical protein
LGCTCPDEVFHRIDDRQLQLASNLGVVRRIDVGHRLLVYLVEADDPAWVQRHLGAILRRGVSDRDAEGMNRFRLVIASHRPDLHGPTAQAEFDKLAVGYEKVHLHLVTQDALDGV